MARHVCSTIFLLSCLAMILFAGAEDTKGSRKLFVFGDSFADTGNWEVVRIPTAYVEPYGMTWPGKPTGRFSDGYCLTDILAPIFNTSVPPTYRKYTENAVNASELLYGINFAYGGSGLTDYAFQNRSLTLQVNDFLALVQKNLYTKSDLENSVIVISNLGNDLAGYRFRFFLPESEIGVCYDRMRESLLQNLRKLQSLGMKRLILNSIQCGDYDITCIRHNQAVKEQVEELFSEINGSNFVIFDYIPLLQEAKMQFGHKEWPENQSCCQGIPGKGPVPNICGTVDDTGKKQYTLCEKPEVAFLFNDGHISHRGWLTILDIFTRFKEFDALL